MEDRTDKELNDILNNTQFTYEILSDFKGRTILHVYSRSNPSRSLTYRGKDLVECKEQFAHIFAL